MTFRSGITELAEEANMPRDKARRILTAAGIRRDKYRQYPHDEALSALTAFSDANMAAGNHLTGRGSDSVSSNLDALAAAKASAETARARKLELEVAQREGRLIPKADVIEAVTDFVTYLRNSLLATGNRVANQCAGRSADEIAAIVNETIRDALSDLSDPGIYVEREVIGA